MGGYNSGGSNHNGRPSVENCMPLNITSIRNMGVLELGAIGVFCWTGKRVGFQAIDNDMLLLRWRERQSSAINSQYIGFQWLAHKRHFGGFQTYLVCPTCFDCRMNLYFYYNHFACRVCHGLQYKSQRRSKYWRLTTKIETIS
jgi:hypothetical protein